MPPPWDSASSNTTVREIALGRVSRISSPGRRASISPALNSIGSASETPPGALLEPPDFASAAAWGRKNCWVVPVGTCAGTETEKRMQASASALARLRSSAMDFVIPSFVREENGCACQLQVLFLRELLHERHADVLARIFHEIGDLHLHEVASRLAVEAGGPVAQDPRQGPDGQYGLVYRHLVDGEVVGEQVAKPLMGHVVVMVRIAMKGLEERNAAHQAATRLQHSGDLPGAQERVLHMLEDR